MKYVAFSLLALALAGCSSVPDGFAEGYAETTAHCTREHTLRYMPGALGVPSTFVELKLTCYPEDRTPPSEPEF